MQKLKFSLILFLIFLAFALSVTATDNVSGFGVFEVVEDSQCFLVGAGLNQVLFFIIILFSFIAIFIVNELFIKLPLITFAVSIGLLVFAVFITSCGALMSVPFYMFAISIGVLEFMRL